MKAVLLEWYRAAELSCDRAEALVVRDPEIVCRGLMVLAGGMHGDDLNLDAFLTQAREYEDWDDPSDRVRRFFYEINSTHPYAVRRVSEVMKWVQSGEYDRIQRGEYVRRGEEPPAQQEASAAFDFYAERFRAIFKDLGENVTKVGNQIGGLAEQAADWLRNRGGGGGGGARAAGGRAAAGAGRAPAGRARAAGASGSGGSGSGGGGGRAPAGRPTASSRAGRHPGCTAVVLGWCGAGVFGAPESDCTAPAPWDPRCEEVPKSGTWLHRTVLFRVMCEEVPRRAARVDEGDLTERCSRITHV